MSGPPAVREIDGPPLRSNTGPERRGTRFGDGMILVAGTATDSDGTDDLTVSLERDAPGEDHDLSIVGSVDAEELSAGLRVGRQIFRRNVEGAGCECLLDGDVDAAQPGVVHTHVRDEVSTLVRDRDVHRLADLFRLLFSGCNDSSGIVKSNHVSSGNSGDVRALAGSARPHFC